MVRDCVSKLNAVFVGQPEMNPRPDPGAHHKLIGTDEIALSAGLTLPPGALIRNWQT
jgi:hypothetical protein